MRKQYEAYIFDLRFTLALEAKELCAFVTHFGQFGDIEIYDIEKDECVLNTKGVVLDSFYPNEMNREFAQRKARHLTHLFDDYYHQLTLKYPKGRLRSFYKELNSTIGRRDHLEGKVVVCSHCHHKVYPCISAQFNYQCFEEGKELHTFETSIMEKSDYMNMIANQLGCSSEQAERVQNEYDRYIKTCSFYDEAKHAHVSLKDFFQVQYQQPMVFEKQGMTMSQ